MITGTPCLGEAVDTFLCIVHDLGLADYGIRGWGPGYKVPQLIDPEGWVGPWMLKTEEMAVIMLGGRLWPVVYVSDDNACEGVSTRPIDDAQNSPSKVETYASHPVIEGPLRREKWPLIVKMMETVVTESLTIYRDTHDVSIRPLTGFYGVSGALENGEILPFPDTHLIHAARLDNMLRDSYGPLAAALERNAELAPKQDS